MSFSPCVITIDLNALCNNYRTVQQRVGGSVQVAAAVKANAYGLGATHVVPALADAGCTTFFVVTLDEAIAIRPYTTGHIAVLGGPVTVDELAIYREYSITPILNTPVQIDWVCTYAPDLPVIIQLDTGMNRLGLSAQETNNLVATPEHLQTLNLYCVLSHFIASDEKDSPLTAHQNTEFRKRVAQINGAYPGLFLNSLANSSGIFRDSKYHHDMVRPGACLYGVNPTPETTNPMKPVVQLGARVLQIRDASIGQTVGYNATRTLYRPTRIATIGIGYADGLSRMHSNTSHVYWHHHPCPILGRISMDLVTVDISDLPATLHAPQIGDILDIIGPYQDVDQLAHSIGTIGYEVLPQLSTRAERIYLYTRP